MAPQSPPVRPARENDSAALRRLQSHLSEPSPTLLSTAIAELSDSIPIRTSRLLVSPDSDDRPVGYLLAVGEGPIHIAELAVDPDHRRERRATALLNKICDNTTHAVTVHVAAENEPARSLYRRVGFVEAERSPELFEDSEGITLRYPSFKSE
ncbi:MAG: N-acetyltransferase [Euryarchaeota archaeon]|nr:N-acetyltransferase [Euryarchaeota archaeon]